MICSHYVFSTEQFKREKTLLHYQRLQLFRGLIAYLYLHATPTLLEKYILNITIHEVVQAIMDLDDKELASITLNIEPCHESSARFCCTVPRWVVEGFKVYYLESRPNFISSEGLSKVKRTPALEDGTEVTTEPFFVNSMGNVEFRVKTIVGQFTSTVCFYAIYHWDCKINSVVC